MALNPKEAQDLARLLALLWPKSWIQTEKGVWRCVIATRMILALAVILLVLVLIVIL